MIVAYWVRIFVLSSPYIGNFLLGKYINWYAFLLLNNVQEHSPGFYLKHENKHPQKISSICMI
jgi:hypothetical protein